MEPRHKRLCNSYKSNYCKGAFSIFIFYQSTIMEEQLKNMRHSGAHLLAAAVQKLYPDVKLAIGPAISSGFYYDFDFGDTKISEKDFPKIEKEMLKLKKAKLPFEKVEMTIKDAKAFLKDHKQPYSLSLLEDIEKFGSTVKGEQAIVHEKSDTEIVTFYKNGSFMNLCRGGHMKDFSEIGAFKLISVAGAYFRGSEKNPMLTRIYAACFSTDVELAEYLQMQEEAKAKDHRILGPALGLFTFSDEIGAGLPLMLPKGETVKHLLMQYMRQKEQKRGYQYVSTPLITQEGLYKRSGHATYYKDDMYSFVDGEGTRFYIKPMNCPSHHMIFEKIVQSYRDLPLRLAEGSGLYRHELSGTLTGLIRVRGPLTQNDSHIYVRPEQLKEEFMKVLELFTEVYKELHITGYWFRLSLPDFSKDKFAGDQKKWDEAGNEIRKALQDFGAPFVEASGEAAFYGPKLDVQIRNVTGKEDSIATSQVDIVVPERMHLVYTDESGGEAYPIIIHRAILGSYERFMGFLIEQTAGRFPFWLSPLQAKILTVNDAAYDYAKEVAEYLDNIELSVPVKANSLRYTIDGRSESLGRKIREAELEKIPLIFVVGLRDREAGEVSVRTRAGEAKIKVGNIVEYIETYAKDNA